MNTENTTPEDGAKQTGTIDITPTWSGLLPALVAVLEGGTDEG